MSSSRSPALRRAIARSGRSQTRHRRLQRYVTISVPSDGPGDARAARSGESAVCSQRAASRARPERQSPRAEALPHHVEVLAADPHVPRSRGGRRRRPRRTAAPPRRSGTRCTPAQSGGRSPVACARRSARIGAPFHIARALGRARPPRRASPSWSTQQTVHAPVLQHDQAAPPRLAAARPALAPRQQRNRLDAIHAALEGATERRRARTRSRARRPSRRRWRSATPRRRARPRGARPRPRVRASGTPRTASCVAASPSTETVTRSIPAASSPAMRRSSSSVPFVVTSVRTPRRAASARELDEPRVEQRLAPLEQQRELERAGAVEGPAEERLVHEAPRRGPSDRRPWGRRCTAGCTGSSARGSRDEQRGRALAPESVGQLVEDARRDAPGASDSGSRPARPGPAAAGTAARPAHRPPAPTGRTPPHAPSREDPSRGGEAGPGRPSARTIPGLSGPASITSALRSARHAGGAPDGPSPRRARLDLRTARRPADPVAAAQVRQHGARSMICTRAPAPRGRRRAGRARGQPRRPVGRILLRERDREAEDLRHRVTLGLKSGSFRTISWPTDQEPPPPTEEHACCSSVAMFVDQAVTPVPRVGASPSPARGCRALELEDRVEVRPRPR